MTPDAPSQKPRRRIRWMRWLIVIGVLAAGWGMWKKHDFAKAQEEARALGWKWIYDDPVDAVKADWRAAFRKATWTGGSRELLIEDGASYLPNERIVRRLQPKGLIVRDAPGLRDLDTLKGFTSLHSLDIRGCTNLASVDAIKSLTSLQALYLWDCTGITRVDALKNLKSLQVLNLVRCKGLTNVNALKSLPSLKRLHLNRCTGRSPESVAALRAALPGCRIEGP